MVDKMEKKNNNTKMSQLGVLRRSTFKFKGWRLAKRLDLRRTPLIKKCCHVDIHLMFSSMSMKFSTGEVLAVV
jgi:hypothetical protein